VLEVCLGKHGSRCMLVAFATSTVEDGLEHNMIPSERIGLQRDCSSLEDAYVVRGSSNMTFIHCHLFLAQ